MMHPQLQALTDAQHGLVAVWQLGDLGWTRKQIRCRTAGLERVYDGVVRVGPEQPGRTQRWKAATLTSPATVLSHASAADHHGIRAWPRDGGRHATVTRPGTGGMRRHRGLLVHRSAVQTSVVVRGVRCTTVERTLADLEPVLEAHEVHKAVREALRLKRTTLDALAAVAVQRRAERVAELAARYGRLGLDRCRSDAEALALVQLDAAGLPLPRVNVVVAGFEADLFFPDLRLILELDGPSFHVLKDADAQRTLAWTNAGNTVRRLPTDDVYRVPGAVVGIVRAHAVVYSRQWEPVAPPSPH